MPNNIPQSTTEFITAAGFIGNPGAWVWVKTVGHNPLLDEPMLANPAYKNNNGET